MIDFTKLNPENPDTFFMKLKPEGAAVVGIYWDVVDYIEVFNTPSGLGTLAEGMSDNEKAINFWEELVLLGHKIASATEKWIFPLTKDYSIKVD